MAHLSHPLRVDDLVTVRTYDAFVDLGEPPTWTGKIVATHPAPYLPTPDYVRVRDDLDGKDKIVYVANVVKG